MFLKVTTLKPEWKQEFIVQLYDRYFSKYLIYFPYDSDSTRDPVLGTNSS